MLALFASGTVLAAPGELQRTDSLDMRRAGKVSEDERAVLRIEWRVGMAGVEENRTLQEMLDKLRLMEKNAAAVGQAFRNLPAERKIQNSQPAPQAIVQENKAAEGQGDWRLMTANLTALVLVAVWWLSRRKAQKENEAVAAEITAKLRAEPGIEPAPTTTASDLEAPEAAGTEAPVFSFELAPDTTPSSDPAPDRQASAEPSGVRSDIPETGPAVVPESTASTAPPVIDFELPEISSPALGVSPATPTPIAPATIEFTLPENAVVEPDDPVLDIQLSTDAEFPTETHQALDTTLHPDREEHLLSADADQSAATDSVNYPESDPKNAIHRMFKQLGIYRKRGMRAEFELTAERLRKNFNIQAADWDQPDDELRGLEEFPRIAEHLCSIWARHKECIKYLRQLIEDNRDGARAGFPQSVAEEMLLLVEIQKELAGSAQPAG